MKLEALEHPVVFVFIAALFTLTTNNIRVSVPLGAGAQKVTSLPAPIFSIISAFEPNPPAPDSSPATPTVPGSSPTTPSSSASSATIPSAPRIKANTPARIMAYTPAKDILWTFDDCEARAGTGVVAQYISVLKAHGVTRAIFFMTGNCYYSRPDLVAEIQAAGFEIGNHTKSHADLTKLNALEIDAEIAGGPPGATYFRAPYGALNQTVRDRVAAAGLKLLGWGASGGDSGSEGQHRSCTRILEDLVHTINDGDAVLLHMFNSKSPGAVDAYLSGKISC